MSLCKKLVVNGTKHENGELEGEGWGDHEIVSRFYLINEWKIQCKISKLKIHEESVKIKEIENF